MTMHEDYGLDEEDGEELYMLEVVLDRVGVREDLGTAAQDPLLPVLGRIRFGDFPVMEVERNQLLLVEQNNSFGSGGEVRLAGLPRDWRVREDGAGYRVEVTYPDRDRGEDCTEEVQLPRAVVVAGEGLRYLLGVLRERLPLQAYQLLENRISYHRDDMAQRVTTHSFSAGKSCLFHMVPTELVSTMAECPVRVEIFRSSSEGQEFVHSLVGVGQVVLGMSFTRAVLLACTPTAMHPVTAHVDTTVPMLDSFDMEVGDMHLFVRLSCFGLAPFQNEETDEMRKQKFLKNFIEKKPLSHAAGRIDMKYPWKRNLDAVPERPAPKPRLQPQFDADEMPPPPLPVFDFGKYLPNVPRCTPFTPPPCYRRAGDPPLPPCTKAMESQLRREELTKGFQTDPLPIRNVSPKPEQPVQLAVGEINRNDPNKCTCPTIPEELRPTDQQGKPNLQCTCATIVQAIATSQEAQPTPTHIVQTKKENVQSLSKSQPLGESDYEITLTKTECGLEKKKNVEEPVLPEQAPKAQKMQAENNKKVESGKTVLAEEAAKHKEAKRIKSESLEKIDMNLIPEEQASDIPYEMMEHEEVSVKRKFKTLYEATPGLYPGRQYGHRRCVSRTAPVPKHMGWLWSAVNFEGLLKGRGWFPGSIRKDVNNMLNKMKEDAASNAAHHSTARSAARFRSRGRPMSKGAAGETIKYNPNLHFHQKEGFYYVTMIPVKTQSQEDVGIEPAPIEYKFDRKHPNGSESSYGDDSESSSSSNVKSYEINYIAPLAMQPKRKKTEMTTFAVQYNENDYLKKGAKKGTAGKPGTTETPAKEEKKQKKGKGKKEKKSKKGKKK